ncbi:hypothetical protein SAMD00019534_021920 [Acytostelium subglobosum LB1]|uniref:hypothetical protein n=1 Tax=Acytostelium subglobosum LB1 TaxID=1410327 RepID=UPI000644C475|nr:hypothetical protein SAMD00019534_021920 [Acytostelium subglobosum LB1]GAM19017.1 hypothetical protein SAMD00019534_021920 [Acytostelium subglobosum LB1]|eukprot:XP_012756944.1 hypothetical protein SAMD00019534_021920 [Acytostelium subglobosum LB1]
MSTSKTASAASTSFRKASSVIVALKWSFNKPPPYSCADRVLPPTGYDYRIMMVKRSPDLRVFPRAHVFPGGVLDKQDESLQWRQYFDKVTVDLPMRIAALREVFEETNFLIGGVNDAIVETQSVDTIQSVRNLVLKDSIHLLEFLQKVSKDKPKLEDIKEWSRWITPEGNKHRFDTYFYLAPITSYPYNAVVDHTENTQMDWFSPEEALEEHDKGTIYLPPPQWMTMLQMSRFHTLEELMQESSRRQQLSVVFSPKFIKPSVSSSGVSGDKSLKVDRMIQVLNHDALNTIDQGTSDQRHRLNIQSSTGDVTDINSWLYHYENNIKSNIDQSLNGRRCRSYTNQSKL